jgi:hypothetical protein
VSGPRDGRSRNAYRIDRRRTDTSRTPAAVISAPSNASAVFGPPVNGSVDVPVTDAVTAGATVEPCVWTDTVEVGASVVVLSPTARLVVVCSVVGVLVEVEVGAVVPSVTTVVGSATVVDVVVVELVDVVVLVDVLVQVVLVLDDVVLVLDEVDVLVVVVAGIVVVVAGSGSHVVGLSVARTPRFLPG